MGRGRRALISPIAVFAAAALLAAACGDGAVSPTPGPSVAPSSAQPAARTCVDVSLTDPTGEPVFLSGRWRGSGDPNALPTSSVFLLRQTNSCLVWVGLSANEGEALGESWIETFSGQIRPDFTAVGTWDDVTGGGRGTVTVEINFVPNGDRFDVELTLFDSTGNIHHTKLWVREEPS